MADCFEENTDTRLKTTTQTYSRAGTLRNTLGQYRNSRCELAARMRELISHRWSQNDTAMEVCLVAAIYILAFSALQNAEQNIAAT